VASSKSLQQLHQEEDVELPHADEVQIPLPPLRTRPTIASIGNQTPRERPRPVGPDQACNTIARSTPHAPPMPPLLLATATWHRSRQRQPNKSPPEQANRGLISEQSTQHELGEELVLDATGGGTGAEVGEHVGEQRKPKMTPSRRRCACLKMAPANFTASRSVSRKEDEDGGLRRGMDRGAAHLWRPSAAD
jgi:hypothetical protein